MSDWEHQIKELDKRLEPIARWPVDVTRPDWIERLQAGIPPLDEAGVRDATEKLLDELIEAYARGTIDTRAIIRRLFATYRSFAWAATLSDPWTSVEALRRHLILFSMQDQGQDCRDALLALERICREARAAGVEATPVLKEVAAMSSNANKYGMGSTRDLLLDAKVED